MMRKKKKKKKKNVINKSKKNGCPHATDFLFYLFIFFLSSPHSKYSLYWRKYLMGLIAIPKKSGIEWQNIQKSRLENIQIQRMGLVWGGGGLGPPAGFDPAPPPLYLRVS